MSERCGRVVALVVVAMMFMTAAASGEHDEPLFMRRRPLEDQRVMLAKRSGGERRQLMWSDFLYPAKDPESPLNFELDPRNATSELTASQQDELIYDAQHPTPKPTEKSGWKKFWQIFF